MKPPIVPGVPSSKSTVIIRENSWLAKIGGWTLQETSIALTLGNHIYLHHSSSSAFLANKSWVAHELAHVKQYQKYGLLRFLCMYLWESIRVGYFNNRWEVAARLQEKDLTILAEFTFNK